MASEAVKQKVEDILTTYIRANHLRNTPERYAVLDVVYSFDRHFTLDEVGEALQQRRFPVSRATLYNAMRLFIKLRLVVRHRFIGMTKYEACYGNGNHIHQICTVCGRVVELHDPAINAAIAGARLHRFSSDGFTLYIYGICSSCKSKMTRRRNQLMKQQQQDTENEQRKD